MIRAETVAGAAWSCTTPTRQPGWSRWRRWRRPADRAAVDLPHLSEYLSDMAKRDKRELVQRLVVLLVHLLKWDHQKDKRSRSWDLTIQEQRDELPTCWRAAYCGHAEQEPGRAYAKAVRRAAVETDLADKTFPPECPYTLEQVLGDGSPPESGQPD